MKVKNLDKKTKNESIDCYDKINPQAVIDPVTATAIDYSKRKAKEMEKFLKVNKDGFDGAPKQPKPKKVEEPKPLKLDENLFEAYTNKFARKSSNLTESAKTILTNKDMEDLAHRMSSEYSRLYNSDSDEQTIATFIFDEYYLPKHKKFMQNFADFRKDIISSDREAAAFMYAIGLKISYDKEGNPTAYDIDKKFENPVYKKESSESMNESSVNDSSNLNLVKKNAIKVAMRDGYDQIIFQEKDGTYGFERKHSNNRFSDFEQTPILIVKVFYNNGVQDTKIVDYAEESMNESCENDVDVQCRDFYLRTKAELLDGANADVADNIKKAFKSIGGSVKILEKSPEYIQYDGRVGEYTIGGSVSLNRLNGDLDRLAQDLTQALYRKLTGDSAGYTPAFIRRITEESMNESKEKSFNSNEMIKDLKKYVNSCKSAPSGVKDSDAYFKGMNDLVKAIEFKYSVKDSKNESMKKIVEGRKKKSDSEMSKEDLWDTVYNELVQSNTETDKRHRKVSGSNKTDRYTVEQVSPSEDDGIQIKLPTARFDFAKKVADAYGLKYDIHEEPWRDDEDAKFRMVIHL